MNDVGPVYGGKWTRFPTLQSQLDWLQDQQDTTLAKMDLVDDDPVNIMLPILANDRKLRRWVRKAQRSSAPPTKKDTKLPADTSLVRTRTRPYSDVSSSPLLRAAEKKPRLDATGSWSVPTREVSQSTLTVPKQPIERSHAHQLTSYPDEPDALVLRTNTILDRTVDEAHTTRSPPPPPATEAQPDVDYYDQAAVPDPDEPDPTSPDSKHTGTTHIPTATA